MFKACLADVQGVVLLPLREKVPDRADEGCSNEHTDPIGVLIIYYCQRYTKVNKNKSFFILQNNPLHTCIVSRPIKLKPTITWRQIFIFRTNRPRIKLNKSRRR